MVIWRLIDLAVPNICHPAFVESFDYPIKFGINYLLDYYWMKRWIVWPEL